MPFQTRIDYFKQNYLGPQHRSLGYQSNQMLFEQRLFTHFVVVQTFQVFFSRFINCVI